MLYYILPPLIIIISVGLLAVFVFNKVDRISNEDLVLENNNKIEKKTEKIFSFLSQIGLKFLERLMHRSKLLSLKFHNMANDWFHYIRERRQEKIRFEIEKRKEQISNIVEDNSKKENQFSQTENQKNIENVNREQRQRRVRIKEKLEDVLIKRIALNPKDIEAYERLGDYYMESGNYIDSLECFKQVLRLNPTHHKAKMRINRIEKIIK